MRVPGGPPRGFDPEGPSSARIHNYLVGGANWGEADEAAARELLGICPRVRRIARASRLFAVRAVCHAAGTGVRQVIDLGCGVPRRAGEALHQAAGLRAAYVDLDEMVLGELDALHYGDSDVALVARDLRDPAAVLADPGLGKVIDLGEPVLVVAGLVLQYQPAAVAGRITAGYMARLAAGSLLAVSVPRFGDPGVLAALNAVYAPAVLHDFTDAEIACLFRPGGDPSGWLELAAPGIGPAAGVVSPTGPHVIAGIGAKR
jgi:hypothetical protein